jgi:hypothetical protein
MLLVMFAMLRVARTVRKWTVRTRICSNRMSFAPWPCRWRSFGALVTSDGSVLSFPLYRRG